MKKSKVKNHTSIKRVLIVDDSSTVLEYLKSIIDGDGNLTVVGKARDGEEAVKLVQSEDPDVVIMDIQMSKMNGYEATREIMEKHPVPIIIVSESLDAKDVTNTFRAMEAGAVANLLKPQTSNHPDSERMAAKLIQTVKLMSEVKVVKRIPRFQKSLAFRLILLKVICKMVKFF